MRYLFQRLRSARLGQPGSRSAAAAPLIALAAIFLFLGSAAGMIVLLVALGVGELGLCAGIFIFACPWLLLLSALFGRSE